MRLQDGTSFWGELKALRHRLVERVHLGWDMLAVAWAHLIVPDLRDQVSRESSSCVYEVPV